MRNIAQLSEALARNGVRFEIQGNMIGIYLGRYVWYWFEQSYGMLMFNHSYSQNTGRIRRGAMAGIRIKSRLSRQFGIMI